MSHHILLSRVSAGRGRVMMQSPLRSARPAADIDGLLCAGGAATVVMYYPREVVFSQGDPADSVMYLQAGTVKLSILSRSGQEGIVAMLEPGAFFAESALVGGHVRHETATAMTAVTVVRVPTTEMIRLIHEQQAFSTRFIAHIVARHLRLEEDIADQLLHTSEQRLARALLLLAHAGQAGQTQPVQPPICQQTLADMVGTTRSRVNFFMNKFKRLGYIDYRSGLKVNRSLATVILRDHSVRPKMDAGGYGTSDAHTPSD